MYAKSVIDRYWIIEIFLFMKWLLLTFPHTLAGELKIGNSTNTAHIWLFLKMDNTMGVSILN
jgi:hypothetical protein